jgi:transcriptional regulator with XRE-family HTH domain
MTGADLKTWRTAHGFTQQQLAERVGGVAANTVARWERSEIQLPAMLENTLRWIEVELQIERTAESRRYRRRFRARERKHPEPEIPAAPPEGAPQTLQVDPTRLRQLLQLVHPDKHGGSKTATDITAWLLSQTRNR